MTRATTMQVLAAVVGSLLCPMATAGESLYVVEVACDRSPPRIEIRANQEMLETGCAEVLLAITQESALQGGSFTLPVLDSVAFDEKPGWPQDIEFGRSGALTLARLQPRQLATITTRGTGETLAFLPNGTPAPGWPISVAEGTAMGAAADLDGDGLEEVVLGSGRFHVLNSDGQIRSGWPYSVPDDGFGIAFPMIGSLSGAKDLVASGTRGTVSVLDPGGNPRAGWPVIVNCPSCTTPLSSFLLISSALGDVTGDGLNELVHIGRDGELIITSELGEVLPGFPIDVGGFNTGILSLADLDDDGAAEAIFTASPVAPGIAGANVLRGDGSQFPGWPQATNGAANGGVAIGDVDQNGELELAVSTINAISTNSGTVHLWRADGSDFPGWPQLVQGVSFPGQVTFADVDGDGGADILAPGIGPGPSFSGVIYAWRVSGALVEGTVLKTV